MVYELDTRIIQGFPILVKSRICILPQPLLLSFLGLDGSLDSCRFYANYTCLSCAMHVPRRSGVTLVSVSHGISTTYHPLSLTLLP